MGHVAALVTALALLASPVGFVQAHDVNGAFSEQGGIADAGLTSWAVLGLRAAGATAPGSLAYLQSQEATLMATPSIALAALAEESLGAQPTALLQKLTAAEKPDGEIGPTLNATFWAVLALGRSSVATTRFVLAHQAASGGWSWDVGVQPDSNDTAAALEALRVAGVHGAPIDRAVKYLLRFENADGGFALSKGDTSDSQSTAWAIQGLLAAGRTPPKAAFAYLARMRRSDGSYRYSAQYVTNPVWVTSQVLAALARKPFPFVS